MQRRIQFIGRSVVTGLRWAREVLDNALLLLGLVTVTGGVAVGGVLLHEPAWFLGVFGGILLSLVFCEGAYRTWDDAQKTVRAPAVGDSRAAVATRLEGWARELSLLQAELPQGQVVGAPVSQLVGWNADYNRLVQDVTSELRRNAPAYLGEWRTHPEGLPWPVQITDFANTQRLWKYAEQQCLDIARKLRT